MRRPLVLAAAAVTLLACSARTPNATLGPSAVLPLWPGGAPGALGSTAADRPTMTVHLPPKARASRTMVVVFPGGGYTAVATATEGRAAVRWLDSLGVASAIVRYRVAPRYHYPEIFQDAQQAVRLVRAHAAEWGVDTARIGVLGFSAGGHLAAMLGTDIDRGDSRNTDAVRRLSARPGFMILVYPVITMDSAFTHLHSRFALIGAHPSRAMVDSLSEEKQVRPDTPPTLLVTTNDDTLVSSENSLRMYAALHRAHVPAGLHIYDSARHGRHGFSIAPADSELGTWPKVMEFWLLHYGMIDSAAVAQ